MTFITTAGWVAQAVKGAVLHGDADTGIARVCTDARKTEPGDLFVGLAANVLTARISRLTPRRAAPPR